MCPISKEGEAQLLEALKRREEASREAASQETARIYAENRQLVEHLGIDLTVWDNAGPRDRSKLLRAAMVRLCY